MRTPVHKAKVEIRQMTLTEIHETQILLEERRKSIELALAASFNVGDEVEYPASDGIVMGVSGEYVGIRHHGVKSIYASVYVLASDVSLVIS